METPVASTLPASPDFGSEERRMRFTVLLGFAVCMVFAFAWMAAEWTAYESLDHRVLRLEGTVCPPPFAPSSLPAGDTRPSSQEPR